MTIRKHVTGKGITILLERKPWLESAAVFASANTGSRNERPEQGGISHVIEHMAFKGTGSRTSHDIAYEIESVGGSINAYTSLDNTAYTVHLLKHEIGRAVDILADIILNPSIPAAELEREKHVIVQEIGAAYDNPQQAVMMNWMRTAWPEQPLGRPVAGTAELVRGFSEADLRTYLSEHYHGGNMAVTAVGSIDEDEFISMVEEKFADVPETPATFTDPEPAVWKGGTCREDRDGLNELRMILGFEGIPYGSPDYYAFNVMAFILGSGMTSRLFQEVRAKRGLCYSIGAGSQSFPDTGKLIIVTAADPNDADTLLDAVMDELIGMAESVSDAELARAKAQLCSSVLMVSERPEHRAEQMLKAYFGSGRALECDELVKLIESVSINDVTRLARQTFREGSRPALSLLGKTDGLNRDADTVMEYLQEGKRK